MYTNASPDPVSNSMLFGLKWLKKRKWVKDRSGVLIKTDVLGGPYQGICGASLRLVPALNH